MIPILAAVISQAASLAQQNLSSLKSQSSPRAGTAQAVSIARQLAEQKINFSGISSNGVV